MKTNYYTSQFDESGKLIFLSSDYDLILDKTRAYALRVAKNVMLKEAETDNYSKSLIVKDWKKEMLNTLHYLKEFSIWRIDPNMITIHDFQPGHWTTQLMLDMQKDNSGKGSQFAEDYQSSEDQTEVELFCSSEMTIEDIPSCMSYAFKKYLQTNN